MLNPVSHSNLNVNAQIGNATAHYVYYFVCTCEMVYWPVQCTWHVYMQTDYMYISLQ